MAAVKTRRRRRAAPKPPPLGKTTWAIVTPTQRETLRENSYGPGATLALAQRLAMEHVELRVERRDLFGPPAHLYTVRRDEETGTITTEIISSED